MILAALLGSGAYFYLKNVNGKGHLETAFLELSNMTNSIQAAQGEFLLHGIENKAYGDKQVDKIKNIIAEYTEDLTSIKANAFLEINQTEKISDLEIAVTGYSKKFEELVTAYHGIEINKESFDAIGTRMEVALEEMTAHHEAELVRLESAGSDQQGIIYQTRVIEHLTKAGINALKVSRDETEFLLTKNADLVQHLDQNLGLLKTYIAALSKELEEPEEKTRLAKIEGELENYTTMLKTMIHEEAIVEKDTFEMVEILHRIMALSAVLSHDTEIEADGMTHEAEITLIALIAIVLTTGALLSFFVARSISKPVRKAILSINEGSDQVASASGEVSQASQSLAEGSSEQAASIEDTSSSLEEMSSMTSQNADNANQADKLMKEVNEVVGRANESMTELTVSMEKISRASEETSKIIKTIDEIAFQTNLLALNAAVEAARAGEAGAGFAVVADEVRNLAMRAAEAAKNTAALIDGTVKKVSDGSQLVGRTNEAFTQVAQSASKVGELVAEIASASSEQAQGIEQVNTAVSEMDKVTQKNAANAEESASASEELNAQAEQMKTIVVELAALVGSYHKGAKPTGAVNKNSSAGRLKKALAKSPGRNKKPNLQQPDQTMAAQTIPFDEDVFKEF